MVIKGSMTDIQIAEEGGPNLTTYKLYWSLTYHMLVTHRP